DLPPATMDRLRLVPLDDTVVFPGMTVTLPVDPGNDRRLFLVPRHETGYAAVGVVAQVVERVRLPRRGTAVVLTGLHRALAARRRARGPARRRGGRRPPRPRRRPLGRRRAPGRRHAPTCPHPGARA